ncbi:MAG: hypothetical protein OXU45_03720 [Candidatus Melainabacteria bacterium]|nr:hypothetical protein [Candidatus Melainabacteria bacterium]
MHNQVVLGFVTLLAFIIMGGWVLPAISLHHALAQQTILHETARSIIENNRTQQSGVVAQLKDLEIPGIKLGEVSSNEQGDYLIYQINFEHTALFIDEDKPKKKMEIVADLI